MAMPDPIGIDRATELSDDASEVASDPTPVEPNALLGGPARCDAVAAGGPKMGVETA